MKKDHLEDILQESPNVSFDPTVEDTSNLVFRVAQELLEAGASGNFSDGYMNIYESLQGAYALDVNIHSEDDCCPQCKTSSISGQKVFTQMFCMAVMYILQQKNGRKVLPNKKEIAKKLRKDGIYFPNSTVCHKCGYNNTDFFKMRGNSLT